MKTYVLPDNLRSSPHLTRLNQEVREGSVVLDWSQVAQASDQALSTLLSGLNLLTHTESLGLGTVHGPLEVRIVDELTKDLPAPPRNGEHPGPEDDPVLRRPRDSELRDQLHDLVVRDLLGPAQGPEEEVDEHYVRQRYLLGSLAPQKQRLAPEDDDRFDVVVPGGGEDAEGEPEDNVRESMLPSSLGLSFLAAPETRELQVSARWGRYERVPGETVTTAAGEPKLVWKRVPVEGKKLVALADGDIGRWEPDPESPDVYVRGRVRKRADGLFVTLFLVNDQKTPSTLKDTAWLFQAELAVEAPDGAAAFRAHAPQSGPRGIDPTVLAEERAMAMLYRRHCEFAVGHGVSVHAEVDRDMPDRALRLQTRAMPWYDVPQTTARTEKDTPALSALPLDMKALAEMEWVELLQGLTMIPAVYSAWIGTQAERLQQGSDGLEPFREAGDEALDLCRQSLERIQAGIALLQADPGALEAFRFMNRAMWQQRVHSVLVERVRKGEDANLTALDVPDNRSWRLFQLAFILLNLPGITDLHHPDRGTDPEAVADLLWFPTGGGKTEAYLGLTAFTLAIRRLQGDVEGHAGGYGVAVLMRYTLRLLTLQQFQRATALICACELIRREALVAGGERWGREPFRIGLWVGQRTTPNKTEQALEAVKSQHGHWHGGSIGGSGSPAQLTNCPWCGLPIKPGDDLQVEPFSGGRGRTLIYCSDPFGRCPFSRKLARDEGLPVVVVDEEIYRLLPSLLISTVDKFAQMPWRGATGVLFGRVDRRCERHGFRSPDLEDSDSHPQKQKMPAARTRPALPARPPDLIIQDELHLISGPLGTLVGLYETAVDHLATWEVGGQEVRPKVVASTATIRRAAQQINGVFLRSVCVFPPHGLDAEDNFFALQRPTDEVPGRRYLGVCAQGRRLKAVLIRVYVAHLAAAQQLYDLYGEAADPWMTLVGYFNSLRELGGMRRLVEDDVRTRLRNMQRRGLANRNVPRVAELTSRLGATEIPEILNRLEQAVRFDQKKSKATSGSVSPVDVLLATNMLSVGVDVPRLGMMVVAGQPKTTSEYIQATSRVGRRHPGLICTVFNWVRPRDMSHYERFEHYHATFYDQVEALTVTPFAPRARDRALSALLVALVRLQDTSLNANQAAAMIDRNHPLVTEAIETIAERARHVTGHDEVRDQVVADLQARLDIWEREAGRTEGGRQLGYEARNDGITVPLLVRPSTDRWSTFTCLTSLRDVEPNINLILNDRGMDERHTAAPRENPAAEAILTMSEAQRTAVERQIMAAVAEAVDESMRLYGGFCYPATEAMFHLLGGSDAGYEPRHILNDGDNLWYLRRGNIVIDAQEAYHGPEVSRYSGAPQTFFTGQPSKRARIVIQRLKKQGFDIPGAGIWTGESQ